MSARNPTPVFLPVGIVFVRTPEHFRTVLNSPHCQDKASFYRFLRVDRGVFAAPTHIWKHDRKAIVPSFGPAMLPRIVDILNAKVVLFVQLLQEHVGKESNILMNIARCFADTIMTSAFGMELGYQQSPDGRKLMEWQDEFIHLAMRRIFSVWLWSDFIYKFTKAYAREREMLRFFHKNVYKIIQANAEKDSKSNDEGPKLSIDKILELHAMKEKPDIQYIREQVKTIFLAGSDTSLTTVSNIMLMLAIHPDIQERVYQELMTVIDADQNEPISQEHAAKLTYMEMVCKETLRLFPIGSMFGRKATADIVLDENTTIPANSDVFLNFFQLHRDPEIWGPNAADFDPERFQPELASQRHPYAYLPFSGGPRMCLGVRYAWLSMKIMLGHVLRRYRLKTSLTMDAIEIHHSMVNRIKQGCLICLEER